MVLQMSRFLLSIIVARLDSLGPDAAKWAQQDSNLRPADYESAALTN